MKPIANRYGLGSLLWRGVGHHRGWQRAWRRPAPASHYDVVIVGGGGHGLAAAYYLARDFPTLAVAVLERSYLGGGNVGRNTTIVRSNYLLPANIRFYDFSMALWRTLSRELNFNVMYSPRGVVDLATSDDEMNGFAIRGNTMRACGADCELLDAAGLRRFVPELNLDLERRYPVIGGLLQRSGGTVRHDAVAWGYARAADALGVDIIEGCEVTDFEFDGNAVSRLKTTRGVIGAGKVALAVAGRTSVLAEKAGLRLPIETHLLQAFVTEPLKPFLNTVLVYAYDDSEIYISQSDKGGLVFGGNLDGYNSYKQKGAFTRAQEVIRGATTLLPEIGQARLLRHWAGMNDMSMDGSPIVGKTPVDNLYLSGGWCYGGFKAIPAGGYCFAHTIAGDEEHELVRPFNIDRFSTGALLDEGGSGPSPRSH